MDSKTDYPESAQQKRQAEAAGAIYGCFVDQPTKGEVHSACVIDERRRGDCPYAKGRHSRETCPFWRLRHPARPIPTVARSVIAVKGREVAPASLDASLRAFTYAVDAARAIGSQGYEDSTRRHGATLVVWEMFKRLRGDGIDLEWPVDLRTPS